MKKYKAAPIPNADKITSYWYREKSTVAWLIITGLIYNGFMAAGPFLQGKLIDSLWENAGLSATIRLSLAFIGTILAIQCARYFKRFYVRRFSNSTSATMRLMVYNNILSRDLRTLENKSTGEIMTRIISDVELCSEGMRKVTTEIFDTGVLLVSYLFVMARMDLKLTALACLFVPLAMVVALCAKKAIYRCTSNFRMQSDIHAASVLETVSHALLYRQNGLLQQSCARYQRSLDALEKSAITAGIVENSLSPLYKCIAMLGIVFIVIIGGQNVSASAWSIGTFSAYLTLFSSVAMRASVAAKIFNSAQKSRISWLRLKPYLGEYTSPQTCKKLLSDINISVQNLEFSYIGAASAAIKNVSFSAKSGDIICVTGAVASGKSALGIALTGAYDYRGSIRLCGHELRDLSAQQKAACIGYMGHAPELFSDTAASNISFNLELSPQSPEIQSVLHDTALDEDLKKMHAGADIFIGNGGISLSGGQQSRVSLARTLLGKKPLIILDDPFSAVDMATEQKIMDNLRQNHKDSIIIILSHRLRIFPHASQVVFLQDGAAPLVCSHAEMLKSCSQYNSIYNLQELSGGAANAK